MKLRTSVVISLVVVLSVGLLGFGVGSAVADTQEVEPNDDFDSAQEVSEGNVTGEITSGDSDFYRIDANDTDALDLELTESPGNLFLRLYGPDRTELVGDGYQERDITLKLPDTGSYYIEIVGEDAEATGNYSLSVEKITPSENDAFAPNDGFESAKTVGEGFTDAKVWGGESDFYRIDANDTDALDLELTETPGDLNLVLYGPDRTELVADTFSNREITLKSSETGTHYIEVEGDDQETTGDYTLSVEKITPAENDDFAPNSDFESAATAEEGVSDAKIWGGESDFYRIDANDTDALDLALPERDEDIDLRLYGPDRTELVADTYQQRDITLKAPETGTYYIEVEGENQETTGDYSLSVEKITPSENDAFAPNDGFESAKTVGEGFTDAKVWGGESDFYRIDANDTDALDLELTETPGDLNLVLYGPDRTELVADTFSNREITLKSSETGTHYIEVEGDDQETTGDYTLSVEKITPAENDDFAPNSDFESAATVEEGFTDATVWGGESDFYRIDANDTDALDLELSETPGDLDLRLYGPDRTELVADTFSNRDITLKAPGTGTYYIEVEGENQETTGDYTLSAEKITPSENDAYAPNDDFESAAVISQEFSDAQIWGGESDFYRVGLNAGEGIDIEAQNTGDVDVRLYDPNRTQVASDGFGSTALTHVAGETGAYFVEVEGENQETTTEYTLRSNRTGVPPGVGTLDVSLSPSTVATDQSTEVDVTVTDAESDNPVTGATVAASTLGVSERTTDSTGTATLTVNGSDTGSYPVSVSADGYENATATLSVQEPPLLGPLSINAGTLDPSTVDENQTVTHDLTFTVDNLSADGDTDTVNVTFPTSATSVSDNDVSVFDANDSEIQISSSTSAVDANDDSVAERLTFAVAPDDTFDTSTVTVEMSVDVGFPDVSENTTLGIDASVTDSDGDSVGSTEVASVTVVDTSVEQPGAPAVVGDTPAQDLDDDDTYEDVNGDGTFNIVDVNALFQNRQGQAVQDNPGLFDFNGDGSVNIVDVNALFQISQS